MKNRLVLLPLAVLAIATGTAQAAPADDLNRVEVAGQIARVERHDVRQACPSIDASLRDSLNRNWFKEQFVGDVVVRFELDGRDVSEVKTQGLTPAYRETRSAVRRAVAELGCTADAAGAQRYAFRIAFKAEGDGSSGGDRFAVSEMLLASKGE